MFFNKIAVSLATVAFFSVLSAQQATSKPGISPSKIDYQKQAQETLKKQQEQRKEAREVRNLLKEKLQEKKEGPKTFYPEEGTEYTHPGAVFFRDGQWEGSDNIFNISKNIGVGVEILVSDEAAFPVKAEMVRSRVKGMLQAAGINPQAVLENEKPPLPFLNIVLIVQPINKGFAVHCSASLLEEVDLQRAKLEQGTWQAITWDRENLVVTSTEEASYHINKCIDDMTQTFIKLYRYFQRP